MTNILKIEMVSTGDEVLYGQITDTNASWLSDFLFQHGFTITSRFTVGDNLNQLIDTLIKRSKENDILIINGGLGPTSDDLSALAAAKANNEELILRQEWLIILAQFFANKGREMPPANVKQAMLPKSASIIDNPVGTACGFKMLINNCVLFFTPGVPSEFKVMIENQILPDIKKMQPNIIKPLCYRLTTMGRTESDLASEIEAKLLVPASIDVGYRSAVPIIELKLTGKISEQPLMDKLWQQLKQLVSDNLLYEGTQGLATVVSQLLQDKSQKLIVLEEQTAGLIAYQLYDQGAPLVKSEVSYNIAHRLNDLMTQFPQALILFLGQFNQDNSQFTLKLVTPKQTYCYQLNYKSRRYDRQTEQQVFSAIALDALRRYLTNQPLVGPNVWLDVIDSAQHCSYNLR
ncbi:CinA family nicotinamide mononucleotide deamidase-related protein [Orbus sturtevantii]|uniref:CinA family nicotinamide mononucleotide deamidase-related protein n=1 Tax=Orbus sturtevantii TaxID=3074109 RepID=UPI00370DCFE7